ncbi:calmodulin-binding protein [Streptomyces sp. NBC_00669]|uniref:BP74-related protein n=1 Tax=unclassified Streptomyces TaxID=2593676 RepID=UPI002E37274E|nr:calmodulin-binding protein [Streptomyces sp. NBC_00669]
MRHVFTKAAAVAAVGVLAFTVAQPSQASTPQQGPVRAAAAGPAYFEMTDITRATFVIKLTNSTEIEHARELISGETTDEPHVITRIIPRPAPYNPRWSYQADSDQTSFFDQGLEVCDATIPYVEEYLDEVGGAFLPGRIWCDWTSRLVREIPAP